MYNVTNDFKTAIKDKNREIYVKAVVGTTTYEGSVVVSLEIDESLLRDDEFTIGTANSSKLSLKLKTKDAIADGSKIVPYVRLKYLTGYTEWVQLGEFYISKSKYLNQVWEIEAYDKLVAGNQIYNSTLSYPAIMGNMLNEICTILGVTKETDIVMTGSVSEKPEGYTISQILGYMFGYYAWSCRINKDGKLSKVTFTGSQELVTVADYIKLEETNPLKTITKIVSSFTKQGDETNLESGTGNEVNTLYIENPFMTQTALNHILSILNGFSYIPFVMPWRNYLYIEIGDKIALEKYQNISWNDIETAWQDTDMRWDTITTVNSVILINKTIIRGGIKGICSAPSKAEQDSNYRYKGVLKNKVAAIDKEALREKKVYYGVSVSREKGIEVKGTNGSEAVYNSDKIALRYNNQDKLYFDAQANKYKFNGDLVAAGGSFSGTVNAGSFVGGSININDNFVVPSTGLLTATGANISGVVNILSGSGIGNLSDAGNLATQDSVDFGTLQVTNKLATYISETISRKWAGESGADITGNHQSYDSFYTGGVPSSIIANWKALGKTTIDGGTIETDTVTALQIAVAQLSAISADMGSINAGSLNIGNGNFIVPSTGLMSCTGANISGAITITSGSGIGNLSDAGALALRNTVNSTYIDDNSISTNKIQADAVKANNIDVTNLSAISGNLGFIFAGSIDASLVTVTNLNATNITAGSIDASSITVTNLNATNITTGSLSADRISTIGLGAEKIYQPSYPNNYAKIGGTYADLELYQNGSKYFTIYNDNLTSVALKYGPTNSELSFLQSSGTTTRPLGNWDFGSITAVLGLETDIEGSHNHGISDGTWLATTDGAGNVTGQVQFVQSGSHYHFVEKT
jgi:hypothetical protein